MTSEPTTGQTTRSEEQLHVGKQEIDAGKARLHKWVETENQSVDVPLRREKATITREPIDRPAGDAELLRLPEYPRTDGGTRRIAGDRDEAEDRVISEAHAEKLEIAVEELLDLLQPAQKVAPFTTFRAVIEKLSDRRTVGAVVIRVRSIRIQGHRHPRH